MTRLSLASGRDIRSFLRGIDRGWWSYSTTEPARAIICKRRMGRQVLELLLAPQEMGRPVVAPPGLPAERLAALRSAFQKTLAGPDCLRDAEKAGVEVQYTSGEAVQSLLERAYAAPPEVVKRAASLLQ